MFQKLEKAGTAFFNAIGGRGFVVWVTATVALWQGVLPPLYWFLATGLFMGKAYGDKFIEKVILKE